MEDDVMKEVEAVSRAAEIARINADFMEKQDKENKRLWAALTISAVLVVCLIFGMVYQDTVMDKAVAEAIAGSQEVFNEALANALDAVAEMGITSDTITTTTTIEGDSAVYNDVSGDQFNDSAQKNGGEQ